MIGLSTLITVYVGGNRVYTGEITTGTIAEFILYVGMLTWPVASMGWVTSIVQRAAASQTRINEFLDYKPEITGGQSGPVEIRGDIEFRDVVFTYPDSGIRALNKVSFQVKAGSSLAIVGKTGSGKSTIAALVSRLYEAQEGEILIDGRPIRQLDPGSLRGTIGYVPQEVFLFSDTIRNNIAFGLPEAKAAETDAIVEQAARDAVIYDNIAELKEGFETRVGERGITLSGGQKQRISIARAIIRKPSIMVFDDCLSAVDTETEEKILENLKRLMQGRTTLIISHRISSVKHCDHIIVLDHGHVAEQGTHQQLLEKAGIYAGLYRKQMLEKELG
jgi:ATP-binding cassette subfamily B protein